MNKIKYIFVILVFSIILTTIAKSEEIEFQDIYNIKDNVNWINGQIVDLTVGKNAVIIFDYLDETCEINVASIQKTTKTVILSLKCGDEETIPLLIKKDANPIPKEIDLDYDDVKDITLLLKKIERKKDKVTIGISKIIPEKIIESNPLWTIGIVVFLFLMTIFYYLSSKKSNLRYEKIKEMIEELENYLSLKQNKNARKKYNEIKELYKKLTLRQQKELANKLNELFEEFEGENKL